MRAFLGVVLIGWCSAQQPSSAALTSAQVAEQLTMAKNAGSHITPVDEAASMVFGVYDLEATPSNGWQLMSAGDFTLHKAAFIKHYNSLGLVAIAPFRSGNCCFSVKGGKKLIISHTPYQYQFPADFSSGAIRCSPTSGYDPNVKYTFYRAGKLTILMDFGEQAACSTNHNPAIWMKHVTPAVTPRRVGYEFGVYDYAVTPPGGWELMSVQDLEEHKAAFVAAYNARGLRVVAPFRSGNCCFAV